VLAALFILPIIAGYTVVNAYPPYKFASAREDKHRLYFRCVQIGLVLTIVSIPTHYMFYVFFDSGWYQSLIANMNPIFETKNTEATGGKWRGEGIAAVLIWTYIHSLIASAYFKLFKTFFKKKYKIKMQEWHSTAINSNPLLKLVNEHGSRENLSGSSIMFTLNTGKVYVGWVKKEPEPSHNYEYIRILPLLSGYRELETQKEKFETFYTAVIEKVEGSCDGLFKHLTEDSFDIVFPVDSIVSAHPFQLEAYKLFKEKEIALSQQNPPDTAM